jgi:hypothetical protein
MKQNQLIIIIALVVTLGLKLLTFFGFILSLMMFVNLMRPARIDDLPLQITIHPTAVIEKSIVPSQVEISITPPISAIPNTDNVQYSKIQLISDLDFTFYPTHKKIANFDIAAAEKQSDGTIIDFDKNMVTYLVGEAKTARFEFTKISSKDGLITTENKDLAGYNYYVAYSEDSSIYGFIFFRFLHKTGDAKFYMIDWQLEAFDNNYFPNVISLGLEINNYKIFNPLIKYASDQMIITKNGVQFEGYGFARYTYGDFKNVKQIDSIDGQALYFGDLAEVKAYFVKSPDGFIFILGYQPKVLENVDNSYMDKALVTWTGGVKNTSNYSQFSSDAVCAQNMFSDIVDVDLSKLKETGKDNLGNSVYEYASITDASFLADLNNYNEVYAEKKLSPAEFAAQHPFFFWKNEYGSYLKFKKEGFYMIGGCGKPAVYLYPEKVSDITVKVQPNGIFTYTLPEYKGAWHVKAQPNGDLYSYDDNSKYDYLWWESIVTGDSLMMPKAGFVVAKSEVAGLLDQKLSRFGLNAKELSQFKEYWLPILQRQPGEYIYITFLFNQQVDQIGKLSFDQKPDTEMRVFMLFRGINQKQTVSELAIPEMHRQGFTAVEWGGGRY